MENLWRAARRRVLTPGVAQTRLDVRGFHEKSPAARELLESIGQTFLGGFAAAAGSRVPDDAVRDLEKVPDPLRGFAYEGAAMAFALLDALPGPGRRRTATFIDGPAGRHTYMAHVGAGWALARLPRPLRSRLPVSDPLLRWLVLDGYGFHQAYFHTAQYVGDQRRGPGPGWPADGPAWYVPHVVDQGIGRALWFVCGTDVERIVRTIDGFAPERHADLYSGVGLAATYAGGAVEPELRHLSDSAGPHRPALAQGSAFAAKARIRAGLLQPGTAVATDVLCGLTPEKAAKVTDDAIPELGQGETIPAYERWRRTIAAQFDG